MKVSLTLTLRIGNDKPAGPDVPIVESGPDANTERAELEYDGRPQYGIGFGRPQYPDTDD